MNQYSVVGLGEILWDIFPQGKRVGGAPANFAFHCRELGAECYVVSAVGDDPHGKEMMNHVRQLALLDDYLQLNHQHATGTVEVRVDLHGKPQYIIHENVAWDFIQFQPDLKSLAALTDAVCFGTLAQRMTVSRDTICRFLAHTNESSLRIFDINLRQNYYSKAVIRQSLDLANILKLNDDELPVLAGLFGFDGNEEQIIEQIRETFDLHLVAVTKGEAGSMLYTSDENSFLETPQVKVVDTVGAGDAFTAALAMGILQQKPIAQIHHDATQLAAYVCRHHGATPSHSE